MSDFRKTFGKSHDGVENKGAGPVMPAGQLGAIFAGHADGITYKQNLNRAPEPSTDTLDM